VANVARKTRGPLSLLSDENSLEIRAADLFPADPPRLDGRVEGFSPKTGVNINKCPHYNDEEGGGHLLARSQD